MSGHNIQKIRSLLLMNPDGLTLQQISDTTGIAIEGVCHSIKKCYGCYVDRWKRKSPTNRVLVQVWKCVSVPLNATRPKSRRTPEEIKAYQAEYRRNLKEESIERKVRKALDNSLKKKVRAPCKAKKARPARTSTGLTTIRGPWPTWN